MRQAASRAKLEEFMRRLGRRARGPGTVYLTGGATALLLGFRDRTVDLDLKLDPEPAGAFEAIARLKEELDLNVELAAPDQFIPELPGWRERSRHILTEGSVEFRHYDFAAQALAKIERGYEQDLADAREFVRRGLVDPDVIVELFEAIRPGIIRYPALDAEAFARKVQRFVEQARGNG